MDRCLGSIRILACILDKALRATYVLGNNIPNSILKGLFLTRQEISEETPSELDVLMNPVLKLSRLVKIVMILTEAQLEVRTRRISLPFIIRLGLAMAGREIEKRKHLLVSQAAA